MAELVKMYRDRDGREADVHPDEVDNYRLGGFICSDQVTKPLGTKSDESVDISLGDLSVIELRARLKTAGIMPGPSTKKADLVALLEGSQAASDE